MRVQIKERRREEHDLDDHRGAVVRAGLSRLLVGIRDDLTFDEPSRAEGRLAATLQGLSDEDAGTVAARIWRLCCDLRDWVKQSERDRP